MPLPLTVSCFSKIQIGITFLLPAHLGSLGQRAVKRVCVCVWLVMRQNRWSTVVRATFKYDEPMSCDIFNLSSSYFTVALTTIRHLCNIVSGLRAFSRSLANTRRLCSCITQYCSSRRTTCLHCKVVCSSYLSLRPKPQALVWDLINMQSVLNHVSDQLSHLTGKCRKIINFQRSVRGGYYTALSYDVIYDVFVLFTFASWTDLVWYFGLMFCILTRSQTDIFLSQTRVRDFGFRPNWPNILSHQINCMSFNSEKKLFYYYSMEGLIIVLFWL